MTKLPRPQHSEYNEYYQQYVALVPDGDITVTLREQLEETIAVLEGFTPEGETFRYAEGKWNIREVITHLMDTERVFAFRALTMARQDGANLPGMDQDEWTERSNGGDRPLADLIQEWIPMRLANVHLFASFDADAGARTGIASDSEISVRALPWLIAGHELWHRGLISEHYVEKSV
jgi:hypothetical protein